MSPEKVSENSLMPLISSVTISIRYSHDALVSFTVASFASLGIARTFERS